MRPHRVSLNVSSGGGAGPVLFPLPCRWWLGVRHHRPRRPCSMGRTLVLLLVQLVVLVLVLGLVLVEVLLLLFLLMTVQLLIVKLRLSALLVPLVKAPTSGRPPTIRWRRGPCVRASAPTQPVSAGASPRVLARATSLHPYKHCAIVAFTLVASGAGGTIVSADVTHPEKPVHLIDHPRRERRGRRDPSSSSSPSPSAPASVAGGSG